MPLASNQVQYSLTYRAPERNGVMAACRELGVTLIAYSPMAQGLLTGARALQRLGDDVSGCCACFSGKFHYFSVMTCAYVQLEWGYGQEQVLL